MSLCHRPKRYLSQHFLTDPTIIHKALDAARVEAGDSVLEIGPGTGALTKALLKRQAQVLAIEKDRQLAAALQATERLAVRCDDALTFPLDWIQPKTKVVANLPYHIATLIIQRLITHADRIQSMTLFVQKEVGMRICAQANSSDYSSFSLFIRAYSHPHYCFTVFSDSFFPAPKVDSSVIHLTLKPFSPPFSKELFFQMVRTAFGKRRKMLRGSLGHLHGKDAVENALHALGKSPLARPGELSLEEFMALFQQLHKDGNHSCC